MLVIASAWHRASIRTERRAIGADDDGAASACSHVRNGDSRCSRPGPGCRRRRASRTPCAGLDRADRGDRQPELRGEAADVVVRFGRRGEQTARNRRPRSRARAGRSRGRRRPSPAPPATAAASRALTVAATAEASQIWPRSASSPSETSIIACAMPTRRGTQRDARLGQLEARDQAPRDRSAASSSDIRRAAPRARETRRRSCR